MRFKINPSYLRHCKVGIVGIAIASFSALAQAPLDVRIALVIGNSAYVSAPPLTNPSNDAKAMTNILKRLGFTVINVNDGTKEQMAAGIAQMQATLKGQQAVGMLYYAGHGLQQNWRNYMVPVDIKVGRSMDIPKQTIDVDSVIEAFKMAGTRMNIIVLDACRDNPFGDKTSNKGLAQIIAPPNTYIAFATAPGNVAQDGTEKSGNGLFTEYIIKELQKPAPIEDMFRRVRLQVRKQSNGTQIPWDSSSLENEFAFNDGAKHTFNPDDLAKETRAQAEEAAKQFKALKNEDKAAAFAQQKADWDKIKDSKNADDFYAYLNKYPTGLISQQATFRLNQLAEAKITVQPTKDGILQKPGEKRYRVGDEYEISVIDAKTGKEKQRKSLRVEKIENGLVYIKGNKGDEISTEDGATVEVFATAANGEVRNFRNDPPLPNQPGGDFKVGDKWESEVIETGPGGRRVLSNKYTVIAIENLTTPAGTFKTFVVESIGTVWSVKLPSVSLKRKIWYEPGWGIPMKIIRQNTQNVAGGFEVDEIYEVISRKRGGG